MRTDAAACIFRRYNNCVSVAWNAYLSTLSHDAVLDTSQLLDLFDNAEDLLNSWVSLPCWGTCSSMHCANAV
jgi:hypothetical protein